MIEFIVILGYYAAVFLLLAGVVLLGFRLFAPEIYRRLK